MSGSCMLLLLCVTSGMKAASSEDCFPQAVARKFAARQVWMHRASSHLRLEGLLPTRGPECGQGPTFCWSLVRRHLSTMPVPPSACLPREGPCLHTHLHLHLPPFHLRYGHYTVHLLTNYSDQVYHCSGGIITVAPAPIEAQVLGHTARTHTRGLPLVLEASWEDPDLPEGESTHHLRPQWSCFSTAPFNPGDLCTTSFGRDPRVTQGLGGRLLTVQRDSMHEGHNYTFRLAVGDRRAEMGRQLGRKMARARVVVQVVGNPVPELRLRTNRDRPVPGDRWVLWAECLSCRSSPTPVYYRWSISRRDVYPPREIDWAQDTEAGTSGGLEMTRVEVLPGRVVQGGYYQVSVRGQYQPSNSSTTRIWMASGTPPSDLSTTPSSG